MQFNSFFKCRRTQCTLRRFAFFFLGCCLCFKSRTTDRRWLNPKIFATQIQIPIPKHFLEFGYRGLVFCRNNGWWMEKMDKEPTVPKWVLINRQKIPQMSQKCSTQFGILEKSSLWVSVVRGSYYCTLCSFTVGKDETEK